MSGTVGQMPWAWRADPALSLARGRVPQRVFPQVCTLFLRPRPHQQVCFTVEEEALTLYIDHHKTAKTKSTPNPMPCCLSWGLGPCRGAGYCWFVGLFFFIAKRTIAGLVSRCAQCILNAPGGEAAGLQGPRQ